jgi:hypothetical protein
MRRLGPIAALALGLAVLGLLAPATAQASPAHRADLPFASGQTAAAGVDADEAAAAATVKMFLPYDNISRAAMARMLHHIEGSPAPGAGCAGMTDVPEWAHDAICWLVNNGHATGYDDNTFRPDGDITRGSMARVVHRIEGSPTPGDGCGGMTDVPEWAQDPICWLVNNGHATGYPDDTFRPRGKVSRGATARTLHHIEGSPAPGAGCGGITDVVEWAHAGICWLINNGHATGFDVRVVTRSRPSDQQVAATLVNDSRASYRLRRLTVNATLNQKAQRWAQYLARIGRLQHSTLSSGVPSNWRALAENVGFGSSITRVHKLFLQSSGHRANILGNYTHLGTGVERVGTRAYVVHVFMRV